MLIPDKRIYEDVGRFIGSDEVASVYNADTAEIVRAALATENTLGSYIARVQGLPDGRVDTDFNPLEYMTEHEKNTPEFADLAMLADSEAEIDALRRQFANESRRREILASAGALGALATFGAGMADPVNLLPIGGVAYKTYKTGGSVLAGAMATASVAAGAAAATEAGLHATQLQRTFGESAINMTAATFLGGVLGAGIARLNTSVRAQLARETEDVMNVEPKLASGLNTTVRSLDPEEMPVIERQFIEEIKAELRPMVSAKLSRGDRRSLEAEIQALHRRRNLVQETPEPIVAAKHVPARLAKRKATQAGEALAAEDKTSLQEKIDIAEQKLARSRLGEEAEADLSRLEQGVIPEPFRSRLDQIRAELSPQQELVDVATPEAETILRDIGTDSVGAMSALQDVQISGRIARGLAHLMRWDPLTRTLTSKNPYTRRLAVKLAENPYLMDGENPVAVESLIHVKTSEPYNRAYEPHLEAWKEYRRGGGRLTRRQFNELVSKEQRNPGTVADANVKKAAAAWEEFTYRPTKEEAIGLELLPKDITRETAAQYLNRQWLPEEIDAHFDVFVSKMASHLKRQALEGVQLTEADAADFLAKVEEFEFEDLARQIGQRLRTVRQGLLPYDYTIGDEIKRMRGVPAGVKKSLSDRFKEISLNVPDAEFEEFLENDIEQLAHNYLRRVIPDIEFSKAFDGQLDMAAEQKAINDWYDQQLLAATTEKERLALGRRNARDITDVQAMNERIRGIYRGGPALLDGDAGLGRIMRVMRDLNYMRLLGGVVAASFSDVARIMMAEGLTKVFSKGLIPLIRNVKGFRVAAHEAKMLGVGDELISGHRVDVMADISDYTKGATAVERGIHSAAQKFSYINAMNYWNAAVKQLQAVVMQNEIVPKLIAGRVDKRLVRLGISNNDQLTIGKQLKKYGEHKEGFWISNVGTWDDPELGLLYKTALRKESDRVIVVPGQERPLFMSTEMGKTLFQFRSFMMSATQRVLISALQGQDANLLSSLIMMTTFGMMTYAFKQWDAGRPLSDDPAVWIAEGIDRSGATGILVEINNTLEKLSSNSIGMRPLLGISTPASRYFSRNRSEALLGPSFGSFLSTSLQVMGSASADYDWTDSDTRALRRLIPGQNLSIIRQGIDKLEEEL